MSEHDISNRLRAVEINLATLTQSNERLLEMSERTAHILEGNGQVGLRTAVAKIETSLEAVLAWIKTAETERRVSERDAIDGKRWRWEQFVAVLGLVVAVIAVAVTVL